MEGVGRQADAKKSSINNQATERKGRGGSRIARDLEYPLIYLGSQSLVGGSYRVSLSPRRLLE